MPGRGLGQDSANGPSWPRRGDAPGEPPLPRRFSAGSTWPACADLVLPPEVVIGGFLLGTVYGQRLAQTREGTLRLCVLSVDVLPTRNGAIRPT
jgi:hypothetical protein